MRANRLGCALFLGTLTLLADTIRPRGFHFELLAIYLPASFRWLFRWSFVKGDRPKLAFPFGSGQQFQSEPFGEVGLIQ